MLEVLTPSIRVHGEVGERRDTGDVLDGPPAVDGVRRSARRGR
jgi:hypothetical protein